jgi:uncharacterized protein (TIRG00374 family)
MKKYFKLFSRILISSGLIVYIFSRINLRDVFDSLQHAEIKYFFIALVFFFISYVINTRKWQILLYHLGFNERLFKLIELNFISLFYASVLPGGQFTGEGVKLFRISRNSNKVEMLVLSVFMDRLTGMVAFVIVGFFGIVFSNTEILYYNKILLVFIILFLLSLLILVLFNNEMPVFFEKLFLKICKHENKMISVARKTMEVIFSFRGAYNVLFLSLMYGMFFQLLNTLLVYLLAMSLGISINPIDLLWVYCLVSFILLIPVTVMGLGIREGALVYLLSFVGVTNTRALSISLLSFVMLFFGSIAGVIFIKAVHFFANRKNVIDDNFR